MMKLRLSICGLILVSMLDAQAALIPCFNGHPEMSVVSDPSFLELYDLSHKGEGKKIFFKTYREVDAKKLHLKEIINSTNSNNRDSTVKRLKLHGFDESLLLFDSEEGGVFSGGRFSELPDRCFSWNRSYVFFKQALFPNEALRPLLVIAGEAFNSESFLNIPHVLVRDTFYPFDFYLLRSDEVTKSWEYFNANEVKPVVHDPLLAVVAGTDILAATLIPTYTHYTAKNQDSADKLNQLVEENTFNALNPLTWFEPKRIKDFPYSPKFVDRLAQQKNNECKELIESSIIDGNVDAPIGSSLMLVGDNLKVVAIDDYNAVIRVNSTVDTSKMCLFEVNLRPINFIVPKDRQR